MTIRTVFFDYGGTLAYADLERSDLAQIWSDEARRLGIEGVTRERARHALDRVGQDFRPSIYDYVGRTAEYWALYQRAVVEALKVPSRGEELCRAVQAVFDDPTRLHLFPEVEGVLAGLQRRNFRLGVISNHHDRLLRDLSNLGIDHFFSTIVFSQEVGCEKPDPRVFEFALRRAGGEARESLHVGDSWTADYSGATGAGLRGVWLNRDGARAPGPCVQVPDLNGLSALLPREL